MGDPIATYEIQRQLDTSAQTAFSDFSDPSLLVKLGTALAVTVAKESVLPGGMSVREIGVRDPLDLCCGCGPTIVVPAKMVSDPGKLTVRFDASSMGTVVRHVYAFVPLDDFRCVATDSVEILSAPWCLGAFVTRTAQASHTRTMDALQKHYAGHA
ncbi:unnamed protein product [Symbiodinium natans]|uniref:Uncharacterized protein n=1 Tax=Symbiodinium natans TaxID=878477 RepID=A0A812M313_9DINO|nr:unnamed protein product [Symbiodinium natans]